VSFKLALSSPKSESWAPDSGEKIFALVLVLAVKLYICVQSWTCRTVVEITRNGHTRACMGFEFPTGGRVDPLRLQYILADLVPLRFFLRSNIFPS
jgi:hypothetical protein